MNVATAMDIDFIEKGEINTIRWIAYILNMDLVIVAFSSLAVFFPSAFNYKTIYNTIYYSSILFSLLYSIYVMFKYVKIRLLTILVFCSMSLLVMASFFTLPEFKESLDSAYVSLVLYFALCMPCFILSSRIHCWDVLLYRLKPYILLSVIFAIVAIYLPENEEIEYYAISGALLIPTIAAMIYWVLKKNKWTGLAAVVNLLVIFVKGSRAPLICIAGAILVVYLWSFKKLTIKKLILFSTCIMLIFVLLFAWTPIFRYLYNRFPESRSIDLFYHISDNEKFQTGRTDLQRAMELMIKERPITGYGAFGTSYYLSITMGFPTMQKGFYAHNIMMDLILQYGIPFGALLFISLLGTDVICVAKAVRDDRLLFIASLLIGYLLYLMFSGTFVFDKTFWILEGFVVTQISKQLHIPTRIIIEGKMKIAGDGK